MHNVNQVNYYLMLVNLLIDYPNNINFASYHLMEANLLIDYLNNFIGVGFDIYSSKQGPEDAMYISPDTRKEIIAKLRILKKKYPNHLLLSHNALNWFEEANHTDDKCYWKTEVLHFNAALEQIRGCEYLDCSNCGCYSGANGSNINFILRWEDKLSRFNPFVNCQ